MAGTLTVQNIEGPSSGANANKIIIPSGQTLDASAGFKPPAGHMIQTVHKTYGTNTTVSSNTTTYPFSQDITVKENSSVVAMLNICSGQAAGDGSEGVYVGIYIGDTLLERNHNEFHANALYELREISVTGKTNSLSAGTYTFKAMVQCLSNASYFRYNWTGIGHSTLTLMEIAG